MKFPNFHTKKRTLLAIAGSVWILAGVNVARLGLLSYFLLENFSILKLFLTLLVFVSFGIMFYKMTLKHQKRIRSYKEQTKPFYYFFDLKSYLIMTFMMGGGIWLRSSGFASTEFIAVFYTGLGFALALAGISFWLMYFKYCRNKEKPTRDAESIGR